MRNQMDDLHAKVLRKYHTICSKLGLSEADKAAIKEGYGVESSADIDTHDLIDLCAKLSRGLDRKSSDMDRLRKRAIAAIGGWLRSTGQGEDISIIKGIACRATGYHDFNKIPAERLRNVGYAFTNKQRDQRGADAVAQAIVAARIAGVMGAAARRS